MFFKKKQSQGNINNNNEVLSLHTKHSMIQKQFHMATVTDENLNFLKAFKPYIELTIDHTVDNFYRDLQIESIFVRHN